MKRKHLLLAVVALAALLVAAQLWLARSSSGSDDSGSPISTADAGFNNPSENANSDQGTNAVPRHAPPDPTRRFRDFTPEQRVEFARKGHGPGG